MDQSNKKVLLAMSGGVDSAVSAMILKEKKYDVVAVTMKIWPKELCTDRNTSEKSCCSIKDIDDAKRVCSKLGIPHYVLDFEKVFKKEVIDYFVKDYKEGKTPNPCILCNEKVKFGLLLNKAKELDCSYIATGHYARIVKNDTGEYELQESEDKKKDQSYVLFSLKKENLPNILFPVGDYKKEYIKKKAERLGLDIHDKPESQEICFVRDKSYVEFLESYCGLKPKTGSIVDKSGTVLGEHKGYWNFTIGQRKGLGVAYKEPLYVLEIEPDENKVIVGIKEDLNTKEFYVKDINWLKDKDDSFECLAKIRYLHKKKQALVKKEKENLLKVEFLNLEKEAITPGQACVFYDDSVVIGGGWITKESS